MPNRSAFADLRRTLARLEDNWITDLIGVICIFALIPLTLMIGEVLK